MLLLTRKNVSSKCNTLANLEKVDKCNIKKNMYLLKIEESASEENFLYIFYAHNILSDTIS